VIRSRAAAAALAAACAGCSLLDPYDMLGRQLGTIPPPPTEVVPSPPPATLGREARLRAFDFVWRTIDERYRDPAFNGVDWKAVGGRYRPLALAAPDDGRFWDALDRMTGELGDSHTRVESPEEVELREHRESISLGIAFAPVEGRLAVTYVAPDSDAWWAGVRPGMIVAAIEGKPAGQAYEELLARAPRSSTPRARRFAALHRLVFGPVGSRVAFAFERADASRIDVSLERRKVPRVRKETSRVLPSGYGYLQFSEWTVGLTLRALRGLEELQGTPGLIIDLRNNPGGSVDAVNWMLDRFFTHRTELGRATTRSGKPVTVLFGLVDVVRLHREVPGDPDAYRGPVVVLVNAGTASGSELFAGSLQAVGRAKVVGETSCGCLEAFLGYARIPGGGALAYSEVGFTLANGKRIEGVGVVPDVPVPVTLEDLRTSRDRALEEAQALLATMRRPAS